MDDIIEVARWLWLGLVAVFGSLMALGRWMLGRQVKRIDAHQEKIDHLKGKTAQLDKEKVDHTTMQSIVDRLAEQQREVLDEVKANSQEARERGSQIHERVTGLETTVVREVTRLKTIQEMQEKKGG